MKKTQIQQFREAARKLGADESEERFDAALGKIGRHKPLPKSEPTKPHPQTEKEPSR